MLETLEKEKEMPTNLRFGPFCKKNPHALQTPLGFPDLLSAPLPPVSLRRRQAQTIRDNATSHKIEYVAKVKDIINPKDFKTESLVQK